MPLTTPYRPSRGHSSTGTLRRWLQLGLITIVSLTVSGCGLLCPKPPQVVVIGTSEIHHNPDGTYTVTAGWMAARLRYEQALVEGLEKAED